jgi:hypothetical protein
MACQALLEVVADLNETPVGDGFSSGPTIYATRPSTLRADAVVLLANPESGGPPGRSRIV